MFCVMTYKKYTIHDQQAYWGLDDCRANWLKHYMYIPSTQGRESQHVLVKNAI